MAPVPVDSLAPQIVENVQNDLLQPHPGVPTPNTTVPPATLDADDVLIAIAGVALVASVSIFIVVKTISVIKNYVQERIRERKVRRGEAIGFKYPYGYRDYKTMSRSGSGSGPAYYHRCKFTLSPDGNNSESDTSSTITRSSRSSSMSTIVSGRICVVYDDTIPSNKPNNKPAFNNDFQF